VFPPERGEERLEILGRLKEGSAGEKSPCSNKPAPGLTITVPRWQLKTPGHRREEGEGMRSEKIVVPKITTRVKRGR